MLLEFKMKNFKSFKEEMTFSMVPVSIKDLEYSVITKEYNEKKIKGLCSSAIYGPNSAGKTNIIGGMEVFRSIVLNGNIKNKDVVSNPNTAIDKLELIPNINSNSDDPVYFYIKFVVENILVEMKLVIKLGAFLENEYNREIVEEELKINNKLIYNRSNYVKFGKIEQINEFLIDSFAKEAADKISQSNLDSQELFFNGMFKALYSKKIYDVVIKWFEDKFKIIYHADQVQLTPILPSNTDDKKFYIDENLNIAVKNFGLTSEDIAFPYTDKKDLIEPISMIKIKERNQQVAIPADIFESFGTIRFLNIFPIILSAIANGSILAIDELDASIHPMAIMNIINIFHNDEINVNGAQLIFNTHNPIFLNNALLRRDEIKFVEKEKDNSIVYSLSDFGTSGSNGVRKTEDYMKNYFINKYGAIKEIDFSDIFYNIKGV